MALPPIRRFVKKTSQKNHNKNGAHDFMTTLLSHQTKKGAIFVRFIT